MAQPDAPGNASQEPPSYDGASDAGSEECSTETSTIVHSGEPFGEFAPRVARLCEEIFPARKLGLKDKLRERAASILPIAALRSKGTPNGKAVIERMRGGDYNRITGITIPAFKGQIEKRLVLRSPRPSSKGKSSPAREVALLQYLHRQESIPVPFVFKYDLEKKNALCEPYVLLQRISGQDLNEFWKDTSFEQKRSVARSLGTIFRQLLSMETPNIGVMGAHPVDCLTESVKGVEYQVDPFEIKIWDAASEDATEPETFRPANAMHTAIDFFEAYFGFWLDRAIKDDETEDADLCKAMLNISREMSSLGFLDGGNCLCHVDLHQRNIMASDTSNNSLQLTGILDWDEALFAPKFLACEPPWWLWHDDETQRHVDENGRGLWPYESAGPSERPATKEQEMLKETFEAYAGLEYVRFAYAAKYRFARCLFRIAQEGLGDSNHLIAIERVISEWDDVKERFQEDGMAGQSVRIC